jgi:hypothetical protein
MCRFRRRCRCRVHRGLLIKNGADSNVFRFAEQVKFGCFRALERSILKWAR